MAKVFVPLRKKKITDVLLYLFTPTLLLISLCNRVIVFVFIVFVVSYLLNHF